MPIDLTVDPPVELHGQWCCEAPIAAPIGAPCAIAHGCAKGGTMGKPCGGSMPIDPPRVSTIDPPVDSLGARLH